MESYKICIEYDMNRHEIEEHAYKIGLKYFQLWVKGIMYAFINKKDVVKDLNDYNEITKEQFLSIQPEGDKVTDKNKQRFENILSLIEQSIDRNEKTVIELG